MWPCKCNPAFRYLGECLLKNAVVQRVYWGAREFFLIKLARSKTEAQFWLHTRPMILHSNPVPRSQSKAIKAYHTLRPLGCIQVHIVAQNTLLQHVSSWQGTSITQTCHPYRACTRAFDEQSSNLGGSWPVCHPLKTFTSWHSRQRNRRSCWWSSADGSVQNSCGKFCQRSI